jgi:hypothetical protein
VFAERPLSSLARELLTQERGRIEAEDIKSRAVARARAALERERRSGIGVRLLDSGPPGTRPRRVARTLRLVAAASCAAGLAAAGTGLFLWSSKEQVKLPAQLIAPPPRPVAVGGGLLPVAPVDDPTEPPAPLPVEAPAPAGSASSLSFGANQYAAELQLLEPARTSLSRGDFAAALASLTQHGRQYPNGQLTQEREALRVRALWGLGQKPAAMAVASAFRKRYPRSTLLTWLKDQGIQKP